MAYHFYIQKYPQDGQTFPKVDIEQNYKCRYKQFKDFAFSGDVKNVYIEDFAEKSGSSKIWIPKKEDLTFQSYDCTLELLFDKQTCLEDVRKFDDEIRGCKIEYSDDFRSLFVTLLMTKQPQIQQEVLYGNRKYMLVSFTFTNLHGQAFKQSQIK